MNEINKRIIIEGEKVHNVGYRPFLLAKALRLRIPNFDAENVYSENGKQKVIVSIKGEERQISEFEIFVRGNIPKNAKVSKVSIDNNEMLDISDVISIDEYRKLLDSEQLNKIVQGGLQISDKIDNLGIGIGDKIDTLRVETNQNFNIMGENFERMDAKYHIISERMFALVDAIEKRQQSFEMHIEKIDKNIETLLEILVKNK